MTLSALSRCFAILAVLYACAPGQEVKDDARARRLACVSEVTLDCNVRIATFCDAGDTSCPDYIACQKLAAAVEKGQVCP